MTSVASIKVMPSVETWSLYFAAQAASHLMVTWSIAVGAASLTVMLASFAVLEDQRVAGSPSVAKAVPWDPGVSSPDELTVAPAEASARLLATGSPGAATEGGAAIVSSIAGAATAITKVFCNKERIWSSFSK